MFEGFTRVGFARPMSPDDMNAMAQQNHRPDGGDVVIWEFDRTPAGVKVYFTTRLGGISRPPYDSLNLAYHVDDDPEAVTANRRYLAGILGIDPSRITSPRQRHTALVDSVDALSEVGAGARSEASHFDPCDGLVTNLRQAPLLLHFADCVPVVLTATDLNGGPALAVLHAGRQGLVEGVVESGVRLMRGAYHVSAAAITAAVGPAIGACCYQVGEDIAAEFESRFGQEVLVRHEDGARLDVQGAAQAALAAAGVSSDNTHVLEICTACDHDFYSYRRDGVTGRHGAIAWIG